MKSKGIGALSCAAVLALAGVAQADILVFTATLSGPAESPPNNSPGMGSSIVTFDTANWTMRVEATWSDLVANVTVAHIHGATALPNEGTAGVMTPTPSFPGFPAGAGSTSGSYDQTFDMNLATSYNPMFLNNASNAGSVLNARQAVLNALAEGKAYLNIHSSQFTGGEIRGFYVPGPGAAGLLAVAGVMAARRRRA